MCLRSRRAEGGQSSSTSYQRSRNYAIN
uniref:Uncharacterized protein n=1 Tax=Anguilla anguilla TaxID=7936 RepID=A0A0E9S8C9_ANGAN